MVLSQSNKIVSGLKPNPFIYLNLIQQRIHCRSEGKDEIFNKFCCVNWLSKRKINNLNLYFVIQLYMDIRSKYGRHRLMFKENITF